MNFKENKLTLLITGFITISIILFFIFFIKYELHDYSKSDIEKKEAKMKSTTMVDKVSFVGVGDNLIHDSIYNAADRRAGAFGDGEYDFSPLYAHIKDEIKPFDIKYINEESIIAGKKYGISAYPQFNAPFALMPAVVNAGFNLINMANNHALDKGSNALLDSINLWNRTNVNHIGAYASQKDRDTPLIINKNNIKIGVLSYTYDTNGFKPKQPYMVPYLTEENVRKDIEKIKPKCDFILVSVHWGDEGQEALNFQQIKFGKLFNDLGVDAVVGCHVHRLQKVEWLTNKDGKKTLIYYGLGNFVHQQVGRVPFLEGMAKFDFVKDGKNKSIENAKFTPLVFHLEYNKYGYDGSVYRLDKYPVALANKHFAMRGNGQAVINGYINTVNRLVPKDMIDMNFGNNGENNSDKSNNSTAQDASGANKTNENSPSNSNNTNQVNGANNKVNNTLRNASAAAAAGVMTNKAYKTYKKYNQNNYYKQNKTNNTNNGYSNKNNAYNKNKYNNGYNNSYNKNTYNNGYTNKNKAYNGTNNTYNKNYNNTYGNKSYNTYKKYNSGYKNNAYKNGGSNKYNGQKYNTRKSYGNNAYSYKQNTNKYKKNYNNAYGKNTYKKNSHRTNR